MPSLVEEGLLFLWVTSRAMELGRECMQLWGYHSNHSLHPSVLPCSPPWPLLCRFERVDELVWVKTNQLQRIIVSGRTGHWLNHSKEHCLIGRKGSPKLNRFLDCDVILSEVICSGVLSRVCSRVRVGA